MAGWSNVHVIGECACVQFSAASFRLAEVSVQQELLTARCWKLHECEHIRRAIIHSSSSLLLSVFI